MQKEITEQELQAAVKMLQQKEGEHARAVVRQIAAALHHPSSAKLPLRNRLRMAAFVKYASTHL